MTNEKIYIGKYREYIVGSEETGKHSVYLVYFAR
jgi:hypothetical protein